MTALWDVAPYGLVEIHRHFKDTYCIYHEGDEFALMMEAVSTLKSRGISTRHTAQHPIKQLSSGREKFPN
jgi:hypothetical protein